MSMIFLMFKHYWKDLGGYFLLNQLKESLLVLILFLTQKVYLIMFYVKALS